MSRNDKIDLIIYSANALLLVVVFLIITALIFSLNGCANKKEIEYKEKVVLNYIPVPTKCDFNITRPPLILYDTLQNRIKSLTELAFDGVKLREALKNIPCLKINYTGDFLNE